MNAIDKAYLGVITTAGVMLSQVQAAFAADGDGTSPVVGGGLNVDTILRDATTEANGAAAGTPFIAKIRAFGATVMVSVFIVAIIAITILFMARGVRFGFSNEQTRNMSKGNIIAVAVGALVVGSAVAIVVFISGIGTNLFG